MSYKSKLLRISDALNLLRKRLIKSADSVGILTLAASFFIFIFQIGFLHKPHELFVIGKLYNVMLGLLFVCLTIRLLLKRRKNQGIKLIAIELVLVSVILLILDARMSLTGFEWASSVLYGFFNHNASIYMVLFLTLILEISSSTLKLSNRNTNPGLLFLISFVLLILIGTGLLILPTASYTGISFTDAFFTATSAVCVTGLVVVDTATCFTPIGKVIIIVLVQLGGLGVMTFTSFFGYFFRGGASFGNQFLIKELINEEKLGEIFKTLVKILILTFSIEAIGVVLIYSTVDPTLFDGKLPRLGFAVFHSISAFCNAGFSTLSNGLNEIGYRHNYNLHYTIGILIMIGGLGFPVVFNFYKLIKQFLINKLRVISRKGMRMHYPRIINVNTRLVIISNVVLWLTGFIFFFFNENHHALDALSLQGKIAGSFFNAVTTRTAGFNTIDLTTLTSPTLLVIIFLMWVGASPASTGGGIKTTTLTVAVLNFFNLSKGKSRIEIFGREIAHESVRRAFAIIFLSLVVLGLSVLLLVYTDGELGISNIIFEAISAFGTVGLSLGITGHLSIAGKWIIVITMFLGRVGTLTILVSIFRKFNTYLYHYPKENILIN